MSCYHLPVKSPQEVPHIGKVRRRHEVISESSYSAIWICVLFLKRHFKVGFCKNKQFWGLGMCFCLITIRSLQKNELVGRYSSRLRNQIIFCLHPSKVFYFKDNWNCVYCFPLRLFPLCVTDVSPPKWTLETTPWSFTTSQWAAAAPRQQKSLNLPIEIPRPKTHSQR